RWLGARPSASVRRRARRPGPAAGAERPYIAAGRRLRQHDGIVLKEWHHQNLKLVLPQCALVESLLQAVALLKRRETAQPDESIGIVATEAGPDEVAPEGPLRAIGTRLPEGE